MTPLSLHIASRLSLEILSILCAATAPAAFAETPEMKTTVESTPLTRTELARARMSNLSEAEWRRYQSLLQGPRGLWTPNLDPVWMLGIDARSEAERRKYAEMAARQERARVERELAFQRAYDEAWIRLYGKEPIIDAKKVRAMRAGAAASNASFSPVAPAPAALQPGDRVMFFTRINECAACDAEWRRLSSRLKADSDLAVDVYFIGTDAKDDDIIRKWAADRGVPSALTRAHRLTLNRDGQVLTRMGVTRAALPMLMIRRGQQALRVTSSELGR